MKYGFDNNKYLKMQSEHIKERIAMFGDKLYLEFGGKLFDDYHASRVLPGFEPDSKFKMLQQLKDQAEIVLSSARLPLKKIKSAGIPALPTTLRSCALSKPSAKWASWPIPLLSPSMRDSPPPTSTAAA